MEKVQGEVSEESPALLDLSRTNRRWKGDSVTIYDMVNVHLRLSLLAMDETASISVRILNYNN